MDEALDVACDVLEQDGHNEAVQLLRLLKGKTKTELQAAVRAVQFALEPEQEGPLDPRSPEGIAATLEGALVAMQHIGGYDPGP